MCENISTSLQSSKEPSQALHPLPALHNRHHQSWVTVDRFPPKETWSWVYRPVFLSRAHSRQLMEGLELARTRGQQLFHVPSAGSTGGAVPGADRTSPNFCFHVSAGSQHLPSLTISFSKFWPSLQVPALSCFNLFLALPCSELWVS